VKLVAPTRATPFGFINFASDFSLLVVSLSLNHLLSYYQITGYSIKGQTYIFAGSFRRVYYYGRECIRRAFFLAFILIVRRCENDTADTGHFSPFGLSHRDK